MKRKKPAAKPVPKKPASKVPAWLRRVDPLDGLALAAGVTWLAVALFGRPIGDYGVETDFYGDFIKYAREWMAGNPTVMNGFRGPFYYFLVGLADTLTPDAFFGAKVMSALAAVVAVRLTGSLVRSLAGPLAGFTAAAFLAGATTLVAFSFRACSDVVFLAMFAAVLVLVFRESVRDAQGGVLRQLWPWLAAGLLAGACWLTRYNGVALVPAVFVVALVAVRPWKRAVLGSVGFAAAFLVVALPWMLFLQQQTGDPLWSNSYQNVAIEVYVSNPAYAQGGQFMTQVGFASMGEVVRTDPDRFAAAMGKNLFGHIWNDARQLAGWPWAVAAVLGFVLAWRRWLTRRGLAFLLAGAAVYASLVPVFYDPRFMMPLLVWWGAGVGALVNVLGSGKGRERVGWALALVVVVFAVWNNHKEIRESHDLMHAKGSPVEILALAKEVQGRAVFNERTPIIARKPHIGYYLGAPVIPIPMGSLSTLREVRGHYFLVSGAEVNAFPSLNGLWRAGATGQTPPELAIVGSVVIPAGDQARAATLFSIRDALPYDPPPLVVPHRDRSTLPGMNRLDTLRYRLARWYLTWDDEQPIRPLVERMSEAAQDTREVHVLLGDAATRNRNTAQARAYYDQAAAQGQDEALAMRRLALPVADKDDTAFDTAWNAWFPQSRWASMPPDSLMEYVVTLAAAGDYVASVGPIYGVARAYPDEPNALKLLSRCYEKMGWDTEAAAAMEVYRRMRPDDPDLAPWVKTEGGGE